MTPFDHFDKLFGDLGLSPDDAALYLFLAGWDSAHREMAEHAAAEREACIADIQLCIPRSGHSTPEIVFAKKAIDRIRARGTK